MPFFLPQSYLGLPLSPHKRQARDFQPLVTKFDKYFVGWKDGLISIDGRLVLVNVVLGSLAIYFLSSNLLPQSVVALLNARRWVFLSTGEKNRHGSQCLLAWKNVCQSKDHGGLKIRPLVVQNHDLMMKLCINAMNQRTYLKKVVLESAPWWSWPVHYGLLYCMNCLWRNPKIPLHHHI